MSGRREQLRQEFAERRARYVGDATPPPAAGGPAEKPSHAWLWIVIALLLVAAGVGGWLFCGKKDGAAAEPAASGDNGGGAPSPAAVADLSEEQAEALASYLLPSKAEMEQVYQFVANSPHVTENLRYADTLSGVTFVYDEGDDTVNAYAGFKKTGEGEKAKIIPATTLCGGLVRYARILGLAAARGDVPEASLKETIEAMPRAMLAAANPRDAAEFVVHRGLLPVLEDEAARNTALNFASGMVMGVLSHETGHHALGHLLSTSDTVNLEISRNQEREADLFASSIISASPFGSEYMLTGQLLFWFARSTQKGEEAGDRASGTHPLSRERLENFIRQNEALAEALGIRL